MSRLLYSDYFCGNQASEYARENGYLDYRTLAKAFDAVLNNYIMQELEAAGYYFEIENGITDNSEEIDEKREQLEEIENSLEGMIEADQENSPEYKALEERRDELENEIDDLERDDGTIPEEIYQFFIVSSAGADIIKDWTGDPLFYCEQLDMYVWGVTHWGTSWDYVLTDIKLNAGEAAFDEISRKYQ